MIKETESDWSSGTKPSILRGVVKYVSNMNTKDLSFSVLIGQKALINLL